MAESEKEGRLDKRQRVREAEDGERELTRL